MGVKWMLRRPVSCKERFIGVVLFACCIVSGCEDTIGEFEAPAGQRAHDASGHGSSASSVTVDEIFQLQNLLEIEKALNELKRLPKDARNAMTLGCAYVRCDSRNPDWNSEIYRNSRIRVQLLDNLTLLHARGFNAGLEVDWRVDALKFLADPDPSVFRTATYIVARVGEADDALAIETLALEQMNEASFRIAIAALNSIEAYGDQERTETAFAAIERIYETVDVKRREWVLDILSRLNSKHRLVRSG